MKNENRKFVGVWLDHAHAMVITTEDQTGYGDYAIHTKVEFHGHAAHGSSEHADHHKKQAEAVKYYREVSKHIEAFDDILLFGPGTAQEELFNHLREDKHFQGKKLSIDSAGKLTDNQMIAFVRDFFKPLVD